MTTSNVSGVWEMDSFSSLDSLAEEGKVKAAVDDTAVDDTAWEGR